MILHWSRSYFEFHEAKGIMEADYLIVLRAREFVGDLDRTMGYRHDDISCESLIRTASLNQPNRFPARRTSGLWDRSAKS